MKRNNLDQTKLLFESINNNYDILSPIYSINSSHDNLSASSNLHPKIEISKIPSQIVLINSKNPHLSKKMTYVDNQNGQLQKCVPWSPIT